MQPLYTLSETNVILTIYLCHCLFFSSKRDLEEKRARFGLVECVNHELLQPYPVLHEKPGKYSYIHSRKNSYDNPFLVVSENASLTPLSGYHAGDLVAHIKFTVLLMPNGSDRVTSHPLQELKPTKTIDDPDIKAWLSLPVKTKKKGGGKKKKGKSQLN